jgi:hypothetical protein
MKLIYRIITTNRLGLTFRKVARKQDWKFQLLTAASEFF